MAAEGSFQRLTRRSRDSAREQNAVRAAVEDLQRSGGQRARRMNGVLVPLPATEEWFAILLDGASDGAPTPAYTAWHEVGFDEAGAAFALADGLTGSAGFKAYSVTGVDAPSGTLAVATFTAQEQAVVFWVAGSGGGGGGGLEVKEVDGTPDYTAVTVLSFDQADGFVLTQPGAGQARVDLNAATLRSLLYTFAVDTVASDFSVSVSGSTVTHHLPDASTSSRGVVNTTTQTFGGAKTFVADVHINSPGVNLLFGSSPDAGLSLGTAGSFNTFTVFCNGGVGGGPQCALIIEGGSPQFNFSSTTGTSCPIIKISKASTSETGQTGTINPLGAVATGGFVTALGAAGFTGTIVLAKLTTPTGANGSITVSGGVITAYTAPT